MPLYEFQCAQCGTEFEELVLSSKPEAVAKVTCPTCDSPKVRKKVSAFASSISGGTSSSASAASCAPSGGG